MIGKRLRCDRGIRSFTNSVPRQQIPNDVKPTMRNAHGRPYLSINELACNNIVMLIYRHHHRRPFERTIGLNAKPPRPVPAELIPIAVLRRVVNLYVHVVNISSIIKFDVISYH